MRNQKNAQERGGLMKKAKTTGTVADLLMFSSIDGASLTMIDCSAGAMAVDIG